MWSYDETSPDFGVLKGPMMFELYISNISVIETRNDLGGLLREVAIIIDEDRGAFVNLKKIYNGQGVPIIVVSTVQFNGSVKFCLDYEDSFDKAIEKAKNYCMVDEEMC